MQAQYNWYLQMYWSVQAQHCQVLGSSFPLVGFLLLHSISPPSCPFFWLNRLVTHFWALTSLILCNICFVHWYIVLLQLDIFHAWKPVQIAYNEYCFIFVFTFSNLLHWLTFVSSYTTILEDTNMTYFQLRVDTPKRHHFLKTGITKKFYVREGQILNILIAAVSFSIFILFFSHFWCPRYFGQSLGCWNCIRPNSSHKKLTLLW